MLLLTYYLLFGVVLWLYMAWLFRKVIIDIISPTGFLLVVTLSPVALLTLPQEISPYKSKGLFSFIKGVRTEKEVYPQRFV